MILRILAAPLSLLLVLAAPALAAEKPNILFIYLDDFGWKDTGYMGSDFYETPVLDGLAKGGMVFTNGYSNAANCAPARACLLSGQYTPRHRIFNVGTKPRGKAEFRRLNVAPGTSVLDDGIVTWAESLKKAGYRTGMFGKWHLGPDPTTQGFDVAVEHQKLPGFKGHYGPDGEYLADALTDRTIEFIKDSKDGPWCAYLAHFGVHTPLHPKKDLLPKYESKKPGKLHDHVVMATMIQAIDDSVGRLVSELERLGERDDTVIVFSSDNGGYGPATDMDPLWGYKGTYFEGGIRVPYFIHWPGVVEPGSRSDAPIIGTDIYPTFCEIAGVPLPDQPVDGRSLVPILKGEKESFGERPIFWHFPAYLQSYSIYGEQRDPLFRSRPVSVVRVGDFKLKQYFEDGKVVLYNLKDDIRERKDLAAEMPEKRDELLGILRDWQKKSDAPTSLTTNPKFDEKAERKAIEKALGKAK
ncbi:aryl-sulfate sulfohydrolase [Haloferula helveola]|uniref:Aryl-sulfate sulfohydrolase n=1 Tax=Haloferula helveola TaxID=490095 RepID=A0ABM7RDQ9_9BACT|nr:aryl-sulfate sulfohydrolase [Haloferula helveola]